MTTKIVPMIGIVITLVLAISCSTRPPADTQSLLTFVIDDVAEEQWSHYDDGSFDVFHSVTARITAPADLSGRIVKVRINALAPADSETKIGSEWSVSLPSANPDEDQLHTLVYRRITKSSSDS